MSDLRINDPGTLAELRAEFERYEDALVNNRVAILDELFWDSPLTIRYGTGENLVGYAAIQAFRAGRSPAGLARSLRSTVITTYGRDMGTTMTEFVRDGAPRVRDGTTQIGRQSQTWVRFPDAGWRVVAAHVSLL